jgi:uncharacterized membrane protein
MNTFSAKAMVRFGWETFKKRPWFFAGVQLIIIIISQIATEISSYADKTQTQEMLILALVGVFIGIVIQILLKMGTISFFLKAHEAPELLRVSMLWAPAYFGSYVLASIVVGLVVLVGLILLIVPGIIWALRYMFVPYLVVDRGLGYSEAMKESRRITDGHKWQLLGLIGLLVLVNIAGLIALVVGLLVSIPVSALALAHAYRTLEHIASEVVPAPAA